MSRSYKKYPRVKCEKSCKYGKRLANKYVRRYLKQGNMLSNGCEYKKLYQSADICDYSFVQFKEWAIDEFYKDQYDIINNVKSWKANYVNKTLEEALAEWYVYYKAK